MLCLLCVRFLLLGVVLLCVAAFALLTYRTNGSEAPLDERPEPASVAAPHEPSCDSAHAHVEEAALDRAELGDGASDSRQALAHEQESAPFVPSAIIVATIHDEAGAPIQAALVRGSREAPDSKPITASNVAGMVRLVSDQATASVRISAPGFRSRRFDDVADGDVLTLVRGIGIEVQVPVSGASGPPQRLHVILTPKGTVPWYRARGTTDRWTGSDHEDGELVQPTHDFLRVFGKGEITGLFDAMGSAHVVVSDPGEYEVRIVLGTVTHVTCGYDLKGPMDMEGLREVTPYPMPHITVDASDEGRIYPIAFQR